MARKGSGLCFAGVIFLIASCLIWFVLRSYYCSLNVQTLPGAVAHKNSTEDSVWGFLLIFGYLGYAPFHVHCQYL